MPRQCCKRSKCVSGTMRVAARIEASKARIEASVARQLRMCSTAVLLASASMLVTCGGSASSNTPSPVPGGGGPSSQAARVGWTQPATSLAQASSYLYKVYVDRSNRMDLGSPTCGAGSGVGNFDCSAILPQIAVGEHVLELVAVDTNGSESPKATAISIVVAGNGSISIESPEK